MNNTIAIIRSLIIYGLCLPLAIYIGYLLANPADRVGLTVIVVACFLPLIPALLRWHHLMLVVSWNMSMVLFFIKGSPYLWMAMSAMSLSLTLLQHVLKRNVQFLSVRSVALPLLFLALVIVVTARLTGGIGLAAFGSESFGGKRYIQMFCAIAGFFAITSHRIPPERANLYIGLFFLSSLTSGIGSIAPWVPSGMRIIYAFFPVDNLDLLSGPITSEFVRLGGLTVAATGALCFILARHGMGGLFRLGGERWRFLPLRLKQGGGINQPWRLLAFVFITYVALSGGFRSFTITLILCFAFLFYLEGLIRTKLAPVFLLVLILTAAVTVPFVDKLPLTIQRSLSFLPVNVSPLVKFDAENSSNWRIKIWEEVIPTIPQYLILGKGYAIDAKEFEKVNMLTPATGQNSGEGAALAQDYHSGPLSLLIPLGIFGVIGFLWFMGASLYVLINNYRYGLAEHRHLNTFLLAHFLTKFVMFVFVYGSFQNDLALFTGIVALSLSLNAGMRKPAVAPVKPNPAYLPFRLPKTARV
ncbi:MAG: O-antigen ligase family protein [Verrucomicrobiota bacterium]